MLKVGDVVRMNIWEYGLRGKIGIITRIEEYQRTRSVRSPDGTSWVREPYTHQVPYIKLQNGTKEYRLWSTQSLVKLDLRMDAGLEIENETQEME